MSRASASTHGANSIQQLIAQSPYDPSLAQALEQYVQQQARGSVPYDGEANRHLLKLYQISPDLLQADPVMRLMLLALTQLPAVDYVTSIAMLPVAATTSLQSELQVLQKMVATLENCNYKRFWQDLANPTLTRYVADVQGFDNTIRKYILNIIQSTYRTITVQQLREFLNLSDKSKVQQFLDAQNSQYTTDGTTVTFTAQMTAGTTERTGGAAQDVTSVEYMSRLLASLA